MNPPQPRHLRRNFILLFTDVLAFGIAWGLISPSNVTPDFVSQLTSSDAVIGLSGSIYYVAFLLPQLFFAQIVNKRTRRKPLMDWTILPFRMTLGVAALIIAFTHPEQHTLILITYLTGYSLFALGDGLVSIVWADLLGNAIPERWRGILFGAGQLAVAISALGVREIVRALLGPGGPLFPQNYAAMFGIATVVFLIGGVALIATKEEESPIPIEPGPPMRQYWGYLGGVLRTDRDFRQFVLTRLLLDLTSLAVPFYVVYGVNALKLPNDVVVGDSILIGTVGTAVAALLMGGLSRRSGTRAVIRLTGVACFLHPAFALLSFVVGQPALYGTFFMYGFIGASTTAGFFDWLITHAPPERRPIYVGLGNTISAISHLATFFGGIILKATSYQALFGLAALLAILGLIASLFLSEPRVRSAERLSALSIPKPSEG
ncbi:MAG: MFS transporter [Anaerolineae bacterium]|nr:MFS transporter [Anaerolineae bacterium]